MSLLIRVTPADEDSSPVDHLASRPMTGVPCTIAHPHISPMWGAPEHPGTISHTSHQLAILIPQWLQVPSPQHTSWTPRTNTAVMVHCAWPWALLAAIIQPKKGQTSHLHPPHLPCWFSFRHTSGMLSGPNKKASKACLSLNHRPHVHLTPWGLGHPPADKVRGSAPGTGVPVPPDWQN